MCDLRLGLSVSFRVLNGSALITSVILWESEGSVCFHHNPTHTVYTETVFKWYNVLPFEGLRTFSIAII